MYRFFKYFHDTGTEEREGIDRGGEGEEWKEGGKGQKRESKKVRKGKRRSRER